MHLALGVDRSANQQPTPVGESSEPESRRPKDHEAPLAELQVSPQRSEIPIGGGGGRGIKLDTVSVQGASHHHGRNLSRYIASLAWVKTVRTNTRVISIYISCCVNWDLEPPPDLPASNLHLPTQILVFASPTCGEARTRQGPRLDSLQSDVEWSKT